MKKKINLLIIASILGLIGLSIIQGYLINNTYKLKKDAFITETRQSISQIDDFSPVLDSLSDIWQYTFLNIIADYKTSTATKADLVKGLELVIGSINETYRIEYQKALVENNIPYGIKFHKKIEVIVLLDSIQNDTIFDIEKRSKQIILGDPITDKNALRISTTLWETNHTSNRIINGENKEIIFNLLLQTQDRMDIEGWKKIVFKQMLGLLLLSLLIFSVVIGLLYYSIKSLITQKKIADIKTDFVNNITHELKTPLATLTLATKMLQKDEIKQQPQLLDNAINTIERQNKRLQKLIDQVLNNSLGYKEIQLNKESVVTEDCINTILDDFLLTVTSKDVLLNRNFSIGTKMIRLDKFYVTTALLNILENAVKYSGYSIVVNCNVENNDALKISIKDNGIGISDKDKKQVFDKFFRAGNKEIHNVKGLGLGLYYSSQIIKAHNGTISVEGAEGTGTTFILTIPFN
jgi:two-component system phosphate regulon sensor histidine kinase PhoR